MHVHVSRARPRTIMSAMQSAVQPKSITQWRTQIALLLAWFLMLGLSFPRPGLWPLAHLALVPLTLLAIFGRPLRRIRWLTFAFGTLWWLWMIYWMIPVTFLGYLGLSAIEGSFVVMFVAIIQLLVGDRFITTPSGSAPVLAAGGSRRVRFPIPFILLIPTIWVALEYIPGAIIVDGFPWFLIAHSQPTWFIQIADTVGPYGVSFLVAMTSGMIIDVCEFPVLRRDSQKRIDLTWRSVSCVGIWLLAMACVIGAAILEFNTAWERQSIRIAVIQPNVPQSNKDHPAPGQDRKDFDEMLALSEKALAEKPDLIVWPETMVPQALNNESLQHYPRLTRAAEYLYYHDALEKFAAVHTVNLMVGAHAFTNWREDKTRGYVFKVFNSAFLFKPDGLDQRYFSKIHRVPFGEYMPGVESMPWAKELLLKLTPYESDYTLQPGTEYVRFEINKQPQASGSPQSFRIATPICFEDVISDVPRQMVYGFDGKKRVDVLVNISNDGWFHGTWQGPQHEAIARFRCIENRVPMARSVNTGISSFIDSGGNVLERVVTDGRTQEVAGFAVADVWIDNRVTIYSRIGDAPAVACLVATIGLIAAAIGRKLYRRRGGKP